jgi:hypothetical protein
MSFYQERYGLAYYRARYGWLLTIVMVVLLAIAGVASVLPRGLHAQLSERCFPETGECISGPIRAYWENNGGLAVFGYPITPLRVETIDGWTGPTQWFQRDRLEDHTAEGAGVLAGRLGARLLELRGTPWQTFEKPDGTPPECVFVRETGHNMCPPFLGYWQENGGVERFGYPISEPFAETIQGRELIVQYYERRRMEIHLGVSQVLLGLLGTEVLAFTPQLPATTPPPSPYVEDVTRACVEELLPRDSASRTLLRNAFEKVTFSQHMGCPLVYISSRPASLQHMELGEMLWVDLGTQTSAGAVPPPGLTGRFIYTIVDPGPQYQRYTDTWLAGSDPYIYDLPTPREGLYPPMGGFGKLWVHDSNVRTRLGWAIQKRAQEGLADVVVFDNIYNDQQNLGLLVLLHDTGTVYAFGRVDQPDEVQVIYYP